MTQAYPLQWPKGRQRTIAARRKTGRFHRLDYRSGGNTKITVADAVKRLFSEADRISAINVVISSNLEIRQDGLPRSGQRAPEDPGVCVYFNLAGKPRAMPCDTYTTVEDNIAAVAAHIAATRAIERHGVATVNEMFAGFIALPPADAGTSRSWWNVMGFTGPYMSRDTIQARYRELAKTRHPDKGGSDAAMAELNAALDEALKQ
jgi:hypothetical protein